MQNMLIVLLQVLYTVCVLGLALYGFQTLWLTWQLLRKRPQVKFSTKSTFVVLQAATSPLNTPLFTAWPTVTIQLPIYNERHVIERLIDACAKLTYPADKLQIQVLDDSIDETIEIVQRRVLYWQRKGIDITAVRRNERLGFKAGALAHALPLASGEFIAIFDADFMPPKDFLQQTISPFCDTHR